MKNLSNKFDQLPQDFDREAIWNGIEKPKRSFLFGLKFWGIVAIFAFGAVAFYVFTPEVTSELTTATKANISIEANIEKGAKEGNKNSQSQTTLNNPITSAVSLTNQPNQNVSTSERQTEKGLSGIERENLEVAEAMSEETVIPILNKASIRNLELLPIAQSTVESSFLTKDSRREHLTTTKRKKWNQTLGMYAGFGMHRSDFTSFNEEDAQWRKKLEQGQMDYSFGLRYEVLQRQNYYLSVSAVYHLYKDKINTEYLRETMDQNFLVHYQLFNHYQLLSAKLEIGRRFYQKHFFWDVQGGLGGTFFQRVETDYFLNEGQLATETQIKAAYQSTTDVFFAGQASIGTYLNNRMFIRLGAQVHSWRELTDPQAEIRHRLLPVNGFLEVGMHF